MFLGHSSVLDYHMIMQTKKDEKKGISNVGQGAYLTLTQRQLLMGMNSSRDRIPDSQGFGLGRSSSTVRNGKKGLELRRGRAVKEKKEVI
jgi:hypothetical protein